MLELRSMKRRHLDKEIVLQKEDLGDEEVLCRDMAIDLLTEEGLNRAAWRSMGGFGGSDLQRCSLLGMV